MTSTPAEQVVCRGCACWYCEGTGKVTAKVWGGEVTVLCGFCHGTGLTTTAGQQKGGVDGAAAR